MGRTKRIGVPLFLGAGMMVAGPVIAGCTADVTHAEWAATEGAIGRINLDDVQVAFQKSTSTEAFEKRVNEIYEGDGIVLFRAKEENRKRILEAFEDLNKDGQIDPGKDDLLFTITNDEIGSNHLQGHGANSHHSSFAGSGNFLFTYMILSSLGRGGYGYRTAPARIPQMEKERDDYRGGPGYHGTGGRGQVEKNTGYYNKQKGYNRTSYTKSGTNLSPTRTSYIGSQKASGGFKSSSSGVRGSFAKGGGKGGGGRGGGGGQVIIGNLRK